jgi:uncharacterized membrane protein
MLWAALVGSTIQIDRTSVISSLFDFGERRIAISVFYCCINWFLLWSVKKSVKSLLHFVFVCCAACA